MITIPLRILLVEDNDIDAHLITHHINKVVETPHLKVVDNLEDCKKELQEFVPDVVLSDYNLPTCNGFEVLELVKSIDDSIPLIFITGALEDEELAANTILSGASGFILKKHMEHLPEKLGPLLKKIVFNMEVQAGVRDKIRRNKIVVNQIYNYLDSLAYDTEEQQENIQKIRKNLDEIKPKGDAE